MIDASLDKIDHEKYMRRAIELAEAAAQVGDRRRPSGARVEEAVRERE